MAMLFYPTLIVPQIVSFLIDLGHEQTAVCKSTARGREVDIEEMRWAVPECASFKDMFKW